LGFSPGMAVCQQLVSSRSRNSNKDTGTSRIPARGVAVAVRRSDLHAVSGVATPTRTIAPVSPPVAAIVIGVAPGTSPAGASRTFRTATPSTRMARAAAGMAGTGTTSACPARAPLRPPGPPPPDEPWSCSAYAAYGSGTECEARRQIRRKAKGTGATHTPAQSSDRKWKCRDA